MDAATGVGSDLSASLREQINYTQAELGHKIETLEHEVRAVAHDAKERILGVVDVRQHIGSHPVAACCVAGALGILIGRRGGRATSPIPSQSLNSSRPWGLRVFAPEISMLRTLLVGKALSAAGEWFATSRTYRQNHPK
jgi:hypothetical protein